LKQLAFDKTEFGLSDKWGFCLIQQTAKNCVCSRCVCISRGGSYASYGCEWVV